MSKHPIEETFNYFEVGRAYDVIESVGFDRGACILNKIVFIVSVDYDTQFLYGEKYVRLVVLADDHLLTRIFSGGAMVWIPRIFVPI